MTWQTIVIGSSTFTNCEVANPQFLAAIQAGKILGTNKAALFTWGAHGVIPITFRGKLVGTSAKTDLWALIGELETKTVKRLKADFLNGVDLFGYIQSIVPIDNAGFGTDGYYMYPVQVTFMGGLRSDQGDRGIVYGVVEEANTFSFTGRPVVPLPVGCTAVSESTGIQRVGVSGIIPCVESPTQSRIIYTVATESNLEQNLVTVSRLGTPAKGYEISNGNTRIKTRHAEPTLQGGVDYYYYDGSAWVTGAYLDVYVTETGCTFRSVTTNPPETWVLFSGDPERQTLRMKYPATTISGYEAIVNMELQRGVPYLKCTVENAGSTNLQKAACVVMPYTPLGYFNASGTEFSAASGNVFVTGAGDPANVAWLQSTSGEAASGCEMFGFARKKKEGYWSLAVSTGITNFYRVDARMDNGAAVKRGYSFDPVWFFGGTYVPMGQVQPTGIGLEIISRVTCHQGVIPRT